MQSRVDLLVSEFVAEEVIIAISPIETLETVGSECGLEHRIGVAISSSIN